MKTDAQLQEEHNLEMERIQQEEQAREAEAYDQYCFERAMAEAEADAEAAEMEADAAWHAWSGE